MFSKRRIYFDTASITPIDRRVLKFMRKLEDRGVYNPSSIHKEGVVAKALLAEARKKVAAVLAAGSEEIIFTGSGTEANNLAISGFVESLVAKGRACGTVHIITSAIEHASVLEPIHALEKNGVKVTYIAPNHDGVVSAEEIGKALTKETVLVSIMLANNETGVIQPIKDIAKELRRFAKQQEIPKVILHTDASQGACYEDLHVDRLGIDLMTLDGHKVYGPRGIGALYKRRSVSLEPVIMGGGQEFGLRSGTEHVIAIAGFAEALRLASEEREKTVLIVGRLQRQLEEGIKKISPQVEIRGQNAWRLPYITNIGISDSDAEMLALRLDAKGFAVSTKSSCLRDESESYVLKAMQVANPSQAIRISLQKNTSRRDIGKFLKSLSFLLQKETVS